MPRHTARGLIVYDGKLLLMERWRDGRHYFSVPGGGIEEGELPEQTVVRELREETSLVTRPIRVVFEMHLEDTIHHIFLCEYLSGTPKLDENSEEAKQDSENNRFKPGWVDIEEVASLEFAVWGPLKSHIVDGLKNGFKPQVTVV